MGRRAAGVVLCMTLPVCLCCCGGLQDVKDYWRLVAVRESITSYEFKDTRLDTLINNTRKMVRETRNQRQTRRVRFLALSSVAGTRLTAAMHVALVGWVCIGARGRADQGVPRQEQAEHVLALQRRAHLRHAHAGRVLHLQPLDGPHRDEGASAGLTSLLA